MEQDRKRYIFRYGKTVLADWYCTEEQMIDHAQGMVMGLRVFRKNPRVAVYTADENEQEKLYRIQA